MAEKNIKKNAGTSSAQKKKNEKRALPLWRRALVHLIKVFIKFRNRFWVSGLLNVRLLFAIVFLMIFGIIMIYSASYPATAALKVSPANFARRQALLGGLGLIGMYLISKIDYHVWVSMGYTAAVLAIGLIMLLKTPLAVSSHGASRWLRVGPVQFQVAEPVKLMMMLFYAQYIREHRILKRKTWWGIWLYTGFIAGLMLIISNNMSTAFILMLICFIICYCCDRRSYLYLALIAAVAFLAVFVVLLAYNTPGGDSGGFRLTRIRAWLFPEDYAAAEALQLIQSLRAIGASGFWGRGLGQSLMKFRLSEAYTDYILAIISEELGAFGVCLLLFLFGYLLLQLIKIAQNAYDLEGRVFVVGVFAQILTQVGLNLMVSTGTFPTTGVTLPFISYGGASVIFLLAEMGIVFNVDNYAKNIRYHRRAEKIINEEDAQRFRKTLHY